MYTAGSREFAFMTPASTASATAIAAPAAPSSRMPISSTVGGGWHHVGPQRPVRRRRGSRWRCPRGQSEQQQRPVAEPDLRLEAPQEADQQRRQQEEQQALPAQRAACSAGVGSGPAGELLEVDRLDLLAPRAGCSRSRVRSRPAAPPCAAPGRAPVRASLSIRSIGRDEVHRRGRRPAGGRIAPGRR